MRSFVFAAAIGVATLWTIQLSGPASAQAQQQTFPRLQALPLSSRDALTNWLQRDCSVGLRGSATAEPDGDPRGRRGGVDRGLPARAYT